MGARRTPLSRDRVLRAALKLVDRDGVDALTMRRLGRELGVEAMSLYSYVDSKEDLIEGVVEQVYREMPIIGPEPGPWQDRVRHHAATYRQILRKHPNVVALVSRRPLNVEGTAAFVDSALGLLQSIGLDRRLADRVLGVIAAFTLGQVAEQVGDEQRPGSSAQTRMTPDDQRRFPYLAAMSEMEPADYEQEFELGMDFIILGIEHLLAHREEWPEIGAEADGSAGRNGSGGPGDDETGYGRVIG